MKSPSPVPTVVNANFIPTRHKTSFGCERLTGCFITRSGHVEPALGTPRLFLGEDTNQGQISSAGVFGLNTFSKSEALVQLHRCLAETGQLVVRTADDLLDVWFAGIGDSDDLFLEFVPRGRPADDHAGIRCGLCSLHEAETLLGDIYQGAGSQDLFTTWLTGLRKPHAVESGDDSQVLNMAAAELVT